MNVLSLFAGIGGLDLGLERAGMTIVGQVELDDFCRRVLAWHWPDVPRHSDVRSAAQWWRSVPNRPSVALVCGGFPCQPVSLAGRGLAARDRRWLWPAMLGIVTELRPSWVVTENVLGLRTRGLDIITADLHRLGYAVEARVASACSVGAPHMRRRLFIVANSEGVERWPGLLRKGAAVGQGLPVPADRAAWPTEPDVPRVADGLPGWVDRRRALGNAVVPAVAEYLGRLILAQRPNRPGPGTDTGCVGKA